METTGIPLDSGQQPLYTSGFPMESKGIRLDSSRQYWTTLSSMSLPMVENPFKIEETRLGIFRFNKNLLAIAFASPPIIRGYPRAGIPERVV